MAENSLYPGIPHSAPSTTELKTFGIVLTLLGTIYSLWLLTFWPGVLGEDSLSIMLEVENPGSYLSAKPVFWYYFVKAFYQELRLVEIPIGAQLAFCAIVFSRILSWCWHQHLRKTFYFSLIFICLAPHMVFFIGTLYADAIFSVAATGLLFEVWLAAKSRKITGASLCIIALTLPIAAFVRPNGIIFLAPVILTAFLVDRTSRRWLIAIIVVWCGLMLIGSRLHKKDSHGTLYPLALFETVNFLQPRPMNLWTQNPRVHPRSVEILSRFRPLDNVISNYDPDYWDPLIYKPDGPQLMALPREDKKAIVKDFFLYNLWQNIPKFSGSRVNIFLTSALAQGGIPGRAYAEYVIKATQSKSQFRAFQWSTAEKILSDVHDFSYTWRWLLWSPLLGVALLAWALRKGLQTRSIPTLLVAIPMALQLGAIFFFSIAGEYRYLLPFFTLPLVLLPIISDLSATQKNPRK
ncbi:hypothetical protein AAFF27_23085 [Xylophilus sp. GW821-FHT01B05]